MKGARTPSPASPPALPLDTLTATALAFSVAQKAIALAKKEEVFAAAVQVYFFSDDGGYGREISVPCPPLEDLQLAVMVTEEFRALSEYLWSQGAFRFKHDEALGRQTWESARVWFHLVYTAMVWSFRRTVQKQYAFTGSVPEKWVIDGRILRSTLSDIIEGQAESGSDTRLVTAVCSLSGLGFPDGTANRFGPELVLRKWSHRERAVFLAEHDKEFLLHDGKSPGAGRPTLAIAELALRLPADVVANEDGPRREVAWRLDLVKLALAIASRSANPPAEGTCLIFGRSGAVMSRMNRDHSLSGFGVPRGPYVEVSRDQVREATRFYRAFASQADRVSGLNNALLYFGRSCTAALDSDVLLDAVSGMDHVLTSPGTDAGYRFRLHGTAVLSRRRAHVDPRETFDLLKKLYEARSGPAHGGELSTKVTDAPIAARLALADLIASVVELASAGELRSEDGPKAWQQIEAMVRRRAAAPERRPRSLKSSRSGT